jgi:tRNA(Arg) A34 adenosine deaminase TadA
MVDSRLKSSVKQHKEEPMKLTHEQIQELKKLMTSSAEKGNLANAGCVFEGNEALAFSESLVVTNHDATAHSERMLVAKVCQKKVKNYTPGLKMVTVVEPCLMCLSACSQAGYSEVAYIIPASKYVEKIGWMTDVNSHVSKQEIAQNFSDPITLTHLEEYTDEFCLVFEEVMSDLLK